MLGESIQLMFNSDDSVPDQRPNLGTAKFQDPIATLMLTGLTSAAILSYFGRLDLELDDDEELEIEAIPSSASFGVSSILDGDIDRDTEGTRFFSDVDDPGTVFSDLSANLFPSNSVVGLRFGPASNSVLFTDQSASIAAVPGPSAIPELVAAGALSRKIRRLRAKIRHHR